MTNDIRVSVEAIPDIEATLVSIWKDALPESASITNDRSFLELGGDSLAAMVCINRVCARYLTELKLIDFFLDDSTIIDFARRIVAAQHDSTCRVQT